MQNTPPLDIELKLDDNVITTSNDAYFATIVMGGGFHIFGGKPVYFDGENLWNYDLYTDDGKTYGKLSNKLI